MFKNFNKNSDGYEPREGWACKRKATLEREGSK